MSTDSKPPRRKGRRRRRGKKQNDEKKKNAPSPQPAAGLSRRVFDASSGASTGRSGRSGRGKRRGGRRSRGNAGAVHVGGSHVQSADAALDEQGFGQTWWGKRWLKAVGSVSTAYANRLPRGLSYAQNGHVKEITVKPGKVEAQVHGRRSQPYKVTIQLRQLTHGQWKKVVEMLANRAAFAAMLLAGEMPERITDVFEQCGLSLFPQRHREIKASCSCPDWANPCKHIAATHYVIGDTLDSDPFLLLSLRGRSRDDVLTALRAARSGEDVEGEPVGGPGKEHLGISVGQLDANSFFDSGDDLGEFRFHIAQPEMELPILRRLGPPPSWDTGVAVVDLLRDIYLQTSAEAEAMGLAELQLRPPPPMPEEFEEEDESPAEPVEAVDERRSAAPPGAEAVSVGGDTADTDDDERPNEGPTVLVRRRTGDKGSGRRRRRDAGRKDNDESGKKNKRKKKRDETPEPEVAAASKPKRGKKSEEGSTKEEPSQPRLSRRVVPGSTEASGPTLEERLELIIPITEAMPDGPAIARQIIWALQTHGPATARQLARRTRMKKTAVLQLLQSLLTVGLVEQEGQGERARFSAPDA